MEYVRKDILKYFTTRRITLLATFVALALVLKLLGKALTLTPSFTVTFIYMPWMLSGIILGPFSGIIVCAISDVLGNLIYAGMNAFNPLTLLSNSLFALPVALLYKTRLKNDYLMVIAGGIISALLCTLGIGSYAIYWYYNIQVNFFVYVGITRSWQALVVAVNIVLLCLSIRPLQKVGIYPATRESSIEKNVTAFVITMLTLTALLIAAIITALLTTTGTPITYITISAVYAGLAALAFMYLYNMGKIKSALLYAVISLIISVLGIAVGIIIFTPALGVLGFKASGWFYFLVILPLFSFVCAGLNIFLRRHIISRNAFWISAVSILLSLIGLVLIILAVAFAVSV